METGNRDEKTHQSWVQCLQLFGHILCSLYLNQALPSSVGFEKTSLSATQSCIARQFVSLEQTSLETPSSRSQSQPKITCSPHTLYALYFNIFYDFNSHAKSAHTPSSDLIQYTWPTICEHMNIWIHRNIHGPHIALALLKVTQITILNTCQYTTASVPCYP